LVETTFLYLFYCLVRFNLRRNWQRQAIFIYLSVLALLLSVGALCSFYIHYEQLLSNGFTELSSLKQYFQFLNPPLVAVNEWFTLYLILLPFPFAVFLFWRARTGSWWALVPALATLAVVVATLSRGVYLGLIVFAVVGAGLLIYGRAASLRQALALQAVIGLLLLVVSAPLLRQATVTLSVFGTTSQVRSYEGRKIIWRGALNMAKEHPLLGVGSNNFMMQFSSYQRPEEPRAMAQRAFNYFLQILTEKGALGLLAYGALLIAFAWVTCSPALRRGRPRRLDSAALLFLAAYLAVIARDLSYSSILSSKGVGVILYLMFAHNARVTEEGEEIWVSSEATGQ
jgi:O-antigen ligase